MNVGTNLQADGSIFDRRTLSLCAVLLLIAFTFHFLSGEIFIRPRNIYNLIIQIQVVGIVASGMALIIVTGHIDLSVGSFLGLCRMVMALLQIELLPVNASWNWPFTIFVGLLLATLLGLWKGFWVAYLNVPSFIVTLAGLLIFRGQQ